jgi:hypothetical protein
MTPRIFSTAISLAAMLVSSSVLLAQHAKTPTLTDILQRLENNLNHYDTAVPSFFCDEHVVSQVEPGSRDQDMITDSVFRLKRTPNPDHTSTLVESREIKDVNGKPPTFQNIDGPTLLDGAFEGGLAVVSLKQAACTNYSLQRTSRRRPNDPYVVNFATVLTPQNTADCLLQENSKGRVLVDPVSMQITHLELTTPRHIITPTNSDISPYGKRVITVDYGPVLLGGETFWMPGTISLRVTSGSGTFHTIVWSFQATYRNYHKLEVTSRILPAR